MNALSDADKLRFYRDEIKHEFGLLAMRATILVTCQSFLVVPYAILNTATSFRLALVSIYLVAALGIFTALLLVRPLRAGHRTIDMWLTKQRGLLQGSKSLEELAIERDLIPGTDREASADKEHLHSMAFTTYGPWAFLAFWIAAVAWSTVRILLGLS